MNTVLVLLFLLGFSSFVLSQPTPYFKLSLQWAYSVCNSGPRCSPSNPYASVPPPQYRFTIHGLWPDIDPRQGPSAPANCGGGNILYTPIQDQKQLADMEHFWPNVVNQSDNVRFWGQQWLKHGTCAMPQLTQEQYFDSALNLVKRLQLDSILQGGGLRFGPNYVDVTFLIQQSIGVLPEVVCNTNKYTQQWQIKEIRVCYDQAQNEIDCPSASNSCHYPYELPM